MTNHPTLGFRIRRYRGRRDLPQDDLASQLGVTKQTISMWENDKAVPSRGIRRKLNVLLQEDDPIVPKPRRPRIKELPKSASVTHNIPLQGGHFAYLNMPIIVSHADLGFIRKWLDFMEEALTTPVDEDGDA